MPWGNNSREDNNEPLPVCKFSDKRLIQVLHYQHQHLVFLILESVLYKQDFVALGFHSYTLDVLWPKPGMAGSIDLWAIMDPVYHPGDCGIVFFKQLQYFSPFLLFRLSLALELSTWLGKDQSLFAPLWISPNSLINPVSQQNMY